jgi:hypothetical protein
MTAPIAVPSGWPAPGLPIDGLKSGTRVRVLFEDRELADWFVEAEAVANRQQQLFDSVVQTTQARSDGRASLIAKPGKASSGSSGDHAADAGGFSSPLDSQHLADLVDMLGHRRVAIAGGRAAAKALVEVLSAEIVDEESSLRHSMS